MIEWTPPTSRMASMSQTDVVDHQDTGPQEEYAMNATIKAACTASSAVMLAIGLAKDLFELAFSSGIDGRASDDEARLGKLLGCIGVSA